MINIYHANVCFDWQFSRPNEPTINWKQNKGTTSLCVYPVTVTKKLPFYRNTNLETF